MRAKPSKPIRVAHVLFAALLALGGMAAAALAADKPELQFPRVASAGGVVELAGNILMPDPKATHRILIDATDAKTTEQGTNRHLDTAARALNLYALAGVPNAQVMIEVVVHGPATSLVLGEQAYRERYGKPNPDAELIEALHAAGATISVCGQALNHHGHAPDQVHPRVKVALSAITRVTELQASGYQLLPW